MVNGRKRPVTSPGQESGCLPPNCGLKTALSSVSLIVTDCTESLQVFFRVLASFNMGLDVVKLKMAWVGWIPFGVRPTALSTTVLIAPQDIASDVVWDMAVVLGTLAICF